jgi:hypothetical protein
MGKGLNVGLGVDWQPGLQTGLINNRGTSMIHEIALSCVCRVEDVFAGFSGDGSKRRTEPFCSRCRGDGWIYRSPILLQGTYTSAKFQSNILDVGVMHPGDATFSPQPAKGSSCDGSARVVGAFDKLTATWPQPLDDGHVLVRGAGYNIRSEGIQTFLEENEDRLWYEPATSIWCEDEDGVVYHENADFQLGPGRIIRWIGAAPLMGKRFTIKYNAYCEWIVFQPPTDRIDRGGTSLGELLRIRKKHVVHINPSPYAIAADKESLLNKIGL